MICRRLWIGVSCVARLSVLLGGVARLQLLQMSTPDGTVRDDLDVEAACAECPLDDSGHPARLPVSTRSVVQGKDSVTSLVLSGHLGDTSRVRNHLSFGGLLGLLALSDVSW